MDSDPHFGQQSPLYLKLRVNSGKYQISKTITTKNTKLNHKEHKEKKPQRSQRINHKEHKEKCRECAKSNS